jgi:hypothetical protein
VLAQYHQGQVTVPRLVAQLRAIGVSISKRQVMRLLIRGQDAFQTEARDVLRAGLQTADWITVDDTAARHKAANGFGTQIGNDQLRLVRHYRQLESTELPCFAARRTHRLRDQRAALAYMHGRAPAGPIIACLAQHPDKQFADPSAWQAHVERLGITALTVTPDPTQSHRGALWGRIQALGFLYGAGIVSDDEASLRSVGMRCVGSTPRG